jgi:hypothetical protein
MFSKLMGLTVTAGLVLTLGVLPANAQKAAGKTTQDRECKTTEVSRTGGRARTVLFAKKKARDAWRQKVRKKQGREWASWLFSKDPTYNCFREKGRNRCTVKATPCKLKVVVSGPGKVCAFFKINGTGKASKLKEWAKHKARKVWAQRVKGFYGSKMDTWLLANSKETTCTDNKDGTHVCTVSAQPCRFRILN